MQRRDFLIAGTGLLVLPTVAMAARENPMPEELRKVLERDPTAPVLGNPDGDVTLTEFLDYNCPFCRKMVDPIQRLILSDPKLRVVFREWPVFGPDSEAATRVSLASLPQGKYYQLHKAIYQIKGKATGESALAAAQKLGLDMTRLQKDMQSDEVERHITNSFLLADHMQLMGTPSFIAGDEAAFGELPSDELKALVQRARETLAQG